MTFSYKHLTPTKIVASTVTVTDDLVLITDTSDSDNAKKVTAQSLILLRISCWCDTQVQFNIVVRLSFFKHGVDGTIWILLLKLENCSYYRYR